jgi:hypothetical protein
MTAEVTHSTLPVPDKANRPKTAFVLTITAREEQASHCCLLRLRRCRPEFGWNLRCAISGDVKLSDYQFAFKQLRRLEGEPLGSPLVSFSSGGATSEYPLLSASITRRDRSVDR